MIKHIKYFMKVCIYTLLVCLLYGTVNTNIAQASSINLEVSINIETGDVDLIGVTSNGEGNHVALMIIDPNGFLKGIDQTISKSGGEYRFQYFLNRNSTFGEYIVKINGIKITSFNYLSKQELMAQINSANVQNIPQIILMYNAILGLDLEGDFQSLGNKTPVYEALINNYFTEVDEVKGAFNNAVYAQYIREAAVRLINEATRANIEERLINNQQVIGISLAERYEGLSENKKHAVLNALLGSEKGYNSVEEIKILIDKTIDTILSKDSSNGEATDNDKDTPTRITKITSGGSSANIITPLPTQPPKSFYDLDSVPWAKESIEVLATKGIVLGVGENLFKPNENVTREQFVKMLIEAFGLLEKSAQSDFKDISKSAWYYVYVSSAKKHNITQGLEDGRFGVGAEISRQEMATLAFRTANYANVNLPNLQLPITFNDQEQISDYAMESIISMQKAGIMQGMGDGDFKPKKVATRAMAAKIIFELLKLAK